MSNNKKSMKLYTEEQVRQSLMKHQNAAMLLSIEQIDYLIEEITPIELPSDEEIWNEGKLVFSEKGKTIYTHYNTVPSWSDGAKWMRDKIQGGNNEQQ